MTVVREARDGRASSPTSGVDIIEAGFPIASPGDFEAVRAIARQVAGPGHRRRCARCNERDIERAWRARSSRPNAARIHVFLATSAIHLRAQAADDADEVLERAIAGVERARTLHATTSSSAPEDAARTELDFLCEVVEAAIEAGATTVNIPDTVGYATPDEYAARDPDASASACPNIDDGRSSASHCHNDLGLAVANSLAAVEAGARQVECTINGIGERAGNAALEEVVMALQTRATTASACTTGIETERLYPTSRMLSRGHRRRPSSRTRRSSGATRSRTRRASTRTACSRSRSTYEIMTPEDGRRSKPSSSSWASTPAAARWLGGTASSATSSRARRWIGAFQAFKQLADRKKTIDDADLLSILNPIAPDATELVEAGYDGACEVKMNDERIEERPRTLFEKIWESHLVRPQTAETPAVLYIDLHLVHEVTSPQAFTELRERGLKVRRPERTLATMDHSTPTHAARARTARSPCSTRRRAAQLAAAGEELRATSASSCYALGSDGQGIVHVIGPELGLTQPGMTIVCGDSHTSTHGAFGALAFGIGTSEVAHVLATQCLLQNRAEDAGGQRRRASCAPGVTREGPDPGDHRAASASAAAPATSSSTRGEAIRALSHGRADDRLQHVDRGGRARRA